MLRTFLSFDAVCCQGCDVHAHNPALAPLIDDVSIVGEYLMDKVDGYNGIYKDPDSGVIINRGSSDRDRYKLAKQQAIKNMESHDEIQNSRVN